MFYNRLVELAFLESKWSESQANLLVVYGRRRLGKTELVKEFINGKRSLYLFVNDAEEKVLLDSFAQEMQRQLNVSYALPSVSSFFDALVDLSNHKIIVVFDEFQRFKTNAPQFITELQNRWDNDLRKRKLLLLLVGSSIGMMQRIALSPGGALYKRKTGLLQILPFPYSEFRKVFSKYAEEECISLYSIFGGTPDYFTKISSSDVEKELLGLILQKEAPLYDEPQNLLETESKRSGRYNTILQSIAKGKTTLKEISDQLHLPQSSIPPYLKELCSLLDIIQFDEPVFGKKKNNRFRFKDPFFAFWYLFIYPNRSTLEIKNPKPVIDQIQAQRSSFEGRVFEEIARELLLFRNNGKIGNIQLSITRIGRWWDRKGTAEIDIVAKNHTGTLLGEVRYTNKPMEYDIIQDLVERKQKLLFETGKMPSGKIQYVFFSKNGFSNQCKKYAEQINAELIDLKRLSQLFENKQ
ncbi:MAG TPA: ATP-binding protein [archaeon]|nr:ATP-binding protein [archaeon]